MKTLLIEAVAVGILVVIIGTVVTKVFFNNGSSKDWNKNHVMEISLFFTGFIIHILCEVIGINKWYCKNGNACNKR